MGVCKKEQENLFFIDVQVRGHYPSYAKKLFREKGICLNMEPEDSDILKIQLILCPSAIIPAAVWLRIWRIRRQMREMW